MIPETDRGPNAITKRKQAAMMTAVVKWLKGYVIGSGLVIHFTRWFWGEAFISKGLIQSYTVPFDFAPPTLTTITKEQRGTVAAIQVFYILTAFTL